MQDLAGRAAIVTGASRGIGAATARELARHGAAVLLLARGSGACAAIAEEIASAGGRATAMACDVADHAALEAAVARAREAFGRLDILVNNAAVIEPIGPLAETDPEEWGRATDINLKGVYHGLRAAIPAMLAGGGGVVVNISSGAATRVLEGWSAYCATKAAVLQLTRSAWLEYGDRGIRTVGLSPGTVATDMQRTIKASGINPVSALDWSEHIPPERAARAVAWLCTSAASDLAGEDVSLRDPEMVRRMGLG
jgi:NAD(P)-dependent dehydrogenase (short-subunit alcohol dehydrogenase family)